MFVPTLDSFVQIRAHVPLMLGCQFSCIAPSLVIICPFYARHPRSLRLQWQLLPLCKVVFLTCLRPFFSQVSHMPVLFPGDQVPATSSFMGSTFGFPLSQPGCQVRSAKDYSTPVRYTREYNAKRGLSKCRKRKSQDDPVDIRPTRLVPRGEDDEVTEVCSILFFLCTCHYWQYWYFSTNW